jgi:hypothetical protein
MSTCVYARFHLAIQEKFVIAGSDIGGGKSAVAAEDVALWFIMTNLNSGSSNYSSTVPTVWMTPDETNITLNVSSLPSGVDTWTPDEAANNWVRRISKKTNETVEQE